MQDRRTALAIFLSIIVIVLYTEFVMPKPVKQVSTTNVSTTTAQNGSVTQNTNSSANTVQYQNQNASQIVPAPTNTTNTQVQPQIIVTRESVLSAPSLKIENNLYKATLSLLGGRLTSFKLKNYKAHLNQSEDLDLVTSNNSNFPLGLYFSNTSDAGFSYALPKDITITGATLVGDTYIVNDNQILNINIEATLNDGNKISKQFSFKSDSYLFDLNVMLSKPLSDGSSVWLEWEEFLPSNLDSLRWNPRNVELLDSTGSISRTPLASIPSTLNESPTRWLGLGDSYFMSVLIGQNSGQTGSYSKNVDTYSTKLKGTSQNSNFQVYIGPKEYERLNALGNDLFKAVDLGYFAFVGEPILIALHFLYLLLGNYGLAIVLLTLVIKAALLPLTKTSFKSMKAMQDLQPEVTALRERVKDPTQLNQEIMQLYQKRGVNPMGGCFPILLQMPIFLGMYNALQRSIELRHADFALWINDLSAPEGFEMFGIKIPVMIILMGISMLWQQITTPTTADPAQKRIMYMVPVIFTIMFMIYPFPSGLVLYWLVNNIISIIQQVTLRKGMEASPLKATLLGSVVIFVGAFFITLL